MNRFIGFVIALMLFGPVCSASVFGSDFDQVVTQARGSEVRWFMWGGSPSINSWVDTYVAGEVKRLYDIKLKRVPADASVFVNKLLIEKQIGKMKGSMDLLWINGENFRNAMENELLQGPFAEQLPNFRFVDPTSVEHDFGYPVNGFEAPYGRAQFVLEYDQAKVPDPPRSFAELKEWVKANPGRFTYPSPPDFTGSAFIRQAFYALTGGHQQYMGGVDKKLYRSKSAALIDYLNDLRPYLWQQGKTYPKDIAALDTLFERGEVLINLSYHQANAQSKILQGRYPESVRTYVMEEGSIFNTHFVAIPFNARNSAGAKVVANFLLSPHAQLHKNTPANWGDFTVIDPARLDAAMQKQFAALDLGAATLSLDILARHGVPEIPSAYLELLEADWEAQVLRQD